MYKQWGVLVVFCRLCIIFFSSVDYFVVQVCNVFWFFGGLCLFVICVCVLVYLFYFVVIVVGDVSYFILGEADKPSTFQVLCVGYMFFFKINIYGVLGDSSQGLAWCCGFLILGWCGVCLYGFLLSFVFCMVPVYCMCFQFFVGFFRMCLCFSYVCL